MKLLVQGGPVIFQCKKCGQEKDESAFSKHAGCVSGYDTSACKQCKKSAWDWKQVSHEKKIFNRTKTRAKTKGLEFTLKLEDIVIPEICPVFGRPIIYGDTDWTASIDRIDSEKGYTPDNIVIISNKANRAKNNLTLAELEDLVEYVRCM